MKRGFLKVLWAVLLMAFVSSNAYAQSSSLSGVVVDANGGVVPGATVTVKNNATNVSLESVSNTSGQFSFPGLDAGTYTVTVSLTGFKTFVAKEVRLISATPGNVTATLEVGDLSESIEVKAGSELVQTQSSTVASTLSVEQLQELPLISRNALYAVQLLPGVATTGGPRGAVINGLPNNTVNVTIDGINTGNMLQSTDGFFSMVTPRMDAVEEVTVSGAVPGSSSGPGSVQVGFVTRSGTNNFDSSIYHYWRDPRFNSNYYFNKVNDLEKNNVRMHQFGGRVGGPIMVPGLFDGRNKAFFFFNYEQLYQPNEATRTRTMMRPENLNGIFRYGSNQVDLLALARANGQIATIDPTIAGLLRDMYAQTGSVGTINDLGANNSLQYVYQSPARVDQYAPTTRLDFNLSDAHRLSGTYWLQRFKSDPDILNQRDPAFPGLPNSAQQTSWRNTGSMTLRSTLGSSLVNELRGGFQTSPSRFSQITADQFENQGGLGINFPAGTWTDPTHTTAPAPRNTTTWSIENTLNWLKGSHSFTMGGAFAGVRNRLDEVDEVTSITLGFDTNFDPAASMFGAANFPGASAAQLTEARNLYAILTGRVTSIGTEARLDSATGEYVYGGLFSQRSEQNSFAAFLQDSWRVSPTLTLNMGLRWDAHLPFTPVSATYSKSTLADLCGISGVGSGPGGRGCNFFQPGLLTGGPTTFTLWEPGERTYDANWTDFAPNVGVAWRPNVQDGFLRTLLGDPEQATVRAGYALSYNQERIDQFENIAGDNPGGVIDVPRNNTTGYPLVLPGESHPVLVSQRNRLGPPDFPTRPEYPLTATTADNVNIFPNDLRTPRVHSYSVGFQRSLGADMAIEARYVGNQNKYIWAQENWNERNIDTNGFFNEFRLAQQNLRAHVEAGCGGASNPCSFAYRGPGTGTSPLPIHLAYLGGRSDAGNAGAYTASNFTNAAFLARFSEYEPAVRAAVNALDTTNFRNNARNAGFPANFFMLNPGVGGAFVVQDGNWTTYDSFQLEVRRRLSQGLLVSGSYTYGVRKQALNPGPNTNNVNQTTVNTSLAAPRMEVDNSDIPHAYKVNWFYEIPVGRGRRFGTDMHPVLDGVLGGWEFSGNARFQQQRYQMVGVKLEGMTVSELQDVFQIREVFNPAVGRIQVFSFPQDIIDNTIKAFNSDATSPTGYSTTFGVPTGRYIRPASDASCVAVFRGDCGAADIDLNGPLFKRVDIKVAKKFGLGRGATFELGMELMNVFDTPNFNHSVAFNPAEPTDTFRVTTAYTDINTTADPGGRIGQLTWRISW
jgi:hypothetical protein